MMGDDRIATAFVGISATVDHLFPVQLYGVASCATLQWIFSCFVSGDKLGGNVLNFRLQQCAGSHQSIQGFKREDTDLVIITVARTKVTAIYTAMLLSIELRRVRRILRIYRISFSPSTAIGRITDLDTAVDAGNR